MKTVKEESNPALKLACCRACLATDVNLFNLHENRLAEAFNCITGMSVRESDGLPQQLCAYCCAVLGKALAFRNRSRRAFRCLTAGALRHELTTDYIRTIDRLSHQLLLNLTLKKLDTTDHSDIKEIEEIKKEEDDITNIFLPSDDLKTEYEIKEKDIDDFSDDNAEQIFVATNPVAKVKKERKGRKKKCEKEERQARKIKKRLSDNDFLPDFDFASFERTYGVEIIALSKEEQLAEIQARKTSDNYHYATYKCEECGKGFRAEEAYANHMTRHSPSTGPHACEVCRVRFKRLSRRQEHQDLHRLKLTCRDCGFVSRNRYQAKKHFEWHTGKIHVCKHCGASFSKSSTYLSHVRLQHPAMNAACDVCGETFLGRLGLMQHKARAHQVASVKPESKCSSCGAQFESVEALSRHCDFTTAGVCDPDMRPCLVCGESWPSEESLNNHVRESHDAEQVKCLECNKTFASSSSYDVHHQRVHLNVRWRRARPPRAPRTPRAPPPRRADAMCEICGKGCESNAALVYHQRSHTGERPYKCSQCTKTFTMPQALITHQLVHSDARPYMCAACPKAFKQKVALQLHSRVHTGERPYKCSMCDSSFKQGPHLRTHIKLMHNVPCDKQRRGAKRKIM